MSCKILIRSAVSCQCLSAYVDDITPDIVIASFTGPEPDASQEYVEDIMLILGDEEYRIDRLEFAADEFTTQNSDFVLPDEIVNHPWNVSYELGTGIDAVTNLVKSKAVEIIPKGQDCEDILETDVKAFLYTSSSDLSTLFSTSLAGHITISSVDLDGSFKYLKSVKCSETCSTIVLSAEYVQAVYPGNCKFKLTSKAKAALRSSEEFREQFGDYYVSDMRKGGRLIAVHVCEANSVEDMINFNAHLTMGAKELGSFTLGSEFEKLTAEYKIRVKTQIFCKGCDELPSAILSGEVKTVLDWFNQHKRPVPCFVKLNHYSSLAGDGVLPKTIDYSYDTLQEIKTVYNRFWRLYADIQNIHKNYRDDINEKFSPIYDAVTMRLQEISENREYRIKLLNQIDELRRDVFIILERYLKYKLIKTMKESEPQPGENHKQKTDSKLQIVWEYGCFDYPGAKKKLTPIKGTGHGAGYNRFPIHENDPDKTIVGYRLISNWVDGTNGDWWKLTEHGLLDHKLDIYVSSYYGRGFDWTFEIYTVENKYINFKD